MKRLFILFTLVGLVANAQERLLSAVEVKEQKEPCLQTIKGQIRDQMTNELIPNTIVALSDEEGNPVQTLMATEDATFEFKVDCQNTYTITASKESYNAQSKTFTTNSASGLELQTKILLDQGRIDFITDPVGETKTSDITAIESGQSMHLNAVAKRSLEKEIHQKETSQKSADETLEEKMPEGEQKTPDVILKAKPEPEITKNSFNEDVLVLKPVIFDYESSYLNVKAKKDLLQVVRIMKKNPDLIIECASYTDAKGSEKYNLWMSERRAKRTVDYIVRRGIDPRRISGKGYGESKLINDCTEGINCTDEQRAVNRRTEFKIVKK